MKSRTLHLAGNLAGLVAGLVTAPLTARALGPEGRGEVAIIVVVSTVLMTSAALGLPWLARSEIAQDPFSLSFWRRQARRVGLALVPLAAALGVGTAIVVGIGPAETAATTVLFIIGVFAAARGVEANALISRGRAGSFGLANLAASILTVLSIVTFFALGILTVAVVLWTTVASILLQIVITVAAVMWVTRGDADRLASRAEELAAHPEYRGASLRGRAARAWSAQVAEAVTTRGDTTTVALSAVSAQVGLYSVVALVPQAAYAVFTTVVQAAFSRRRDGDDAMRFTHVFQTCVSLAVVIALVAGPVAWWALPVVFGDEFTASRLFLPGALVMTVGLSAFAPVALRMSAGTTSVRPLILLLGVPAVAAAVTGALAGPAAAVVALGATLLVSSLTYALWVTKGQVSRVSLRGTIDWWRSHGHDG